MNLENTIIVFKFFVYLTFNLLKFGIDDPIFYIGII